MAKKPGETQVRLSSPKPGSARSAKADALEQPELEVQQTRLKKTAAAGNRVLKSPPTMKVEFPAAASASASLLPQGPIKSAKKNRPFRRPVQSTELEIVNVSFTLLRPSASQVSLCGEFNGWSPEAGPMTRHDDGHWEAIVALRPGRYEYKFLVDGEWLPDPGVEQTIQNGYGSLNSVIEVSEIVISQM